jgi:uncharacterized low-complexity protein
MYSGELYKQNKRIFMNKIILCAVLALSLVTVKVNATSSDVKSFDTKVCEKCAEGKCGKDMKCGEGKCGKGK